VAGRETRTTARVDVVEGETMKTLKVSMVSTSTKATQNLAALGGLTVAVTDVHTDTVIDTTIDTGIVKMTMTTTTIRGNPCPTERKGPLPTTQMEIQTHRMAMAEAIIDERKVVAIPLIDDVLGLDDAFITFTLVQRVQYDIGEVKDSGHNGLQINV
jgi:hypothetical protein